MPGNKDPLNTAILQYINEQKKLVEHEVEEIRKIAGVLKHLGEGNPPNYGSHSIHSIEFFLGKEISSIGRKMLKEKFNIAINIPWKCFESGIG